MGGAIINQAKDCRSRFRSRASRFCTALGSAFLAVTLVGCSGGGGGAPPAPTVTLSGTISIPPGVVIDSDVNDPNESYAENDTLATAQPLANPISVGGYVNRANAGEEGRSYAIGDQDDYFEVQCNADDLITLAIGESDTAGNDLDLYLLTTGGGAVDDSLGTGKYESVTAPADGTYIVNVYAYSGASNYILVIGSSAGAGTGAEKDTLSTRYEFVPGQAVVRFRATTPPAGAAVAPTDRAAALGLTLSAGGGGRETLLTFEATDSGARVYEILGVTEDLSRDQATPDPELERKRNTLKVIKALRRRGDILSAEPNYILRHSNTEPNDTHYALQWHYPQINLPQAWDYTTGDSSVIVAVIDTGVLMGHPDLSGKLTSTGYDFISSTTISNDGDGIDANPDDPGDATSGSSSFHGTHCAGTVAARTNNNSGLAGVSWEARVMPIRVLGVGGGTSYDIVQGIRYSAGMSNDSGTTLSSSERAGIISMSLGGGGYSGTTQQVINQVRSAGVIVIAAAGNESTSTPSYPASYDGVVSVSAVNINSTLASYSNYGSYIDVAAPGGDGGDYNGDGYPDRVWSTCGDDSSGSIQYNYVAYNGTSMATPHVAGVVALMKALSPTLTPSELDALLSSGSITKDIGVAGRDDKYGHGLIDALKAVLAVNGGTISTALKVDPAVVNFGTTGTSGTLTVSKIGTEAISVTGAGTDEPWLSVTADSVDGDGLGTYTILADRSGLSDGTHRATVTFTSSLGGTAITQVSLQVSSGSVTYDAGFHYVLLVDGDSFEVLQQVNVAASGGSYVYSFSDVPQDGTYLIVAGSDRDNDVYLDNAGESTGAYLSLDQITYVEAADNLTGLDFTTDLKLSFSTTTLSTGSDETLPRFKRLR